MNSRKLNRLLVRTLSNCRIVLRILPAVVLASITLSGCATSSGNLASPTSLSFGNVVIGSNSHQTLRLTNSGTALSTVTQATASGRGFSLKGPSLPLTLDAGQSVTFTMNFAPTAIGNASGTLSITRSQTSTTPITSVSRSTQPSILTHLETVTMSGIGVPVEPSIIS